MMVGATSGFDSLGVDRNHFMDRYEQKKKTAAAKKNGTVGVTMQAFHAGTAHQQAGRLQDAEREYRAAIDARDDFFEAHVNLGVVLQGLAKAEEAGKAFSRAIDLNPEIAEIHYALATVYQDLNRTEDAQACFGRAMDIKPGYAEALNGLAICRETLAEEWNGTTRDTIRSRRDRSR